MYKRSIALIAAILFIVLHIAVVFSVLAEGESIDVEDTEIVVEYIDDTPTEPTVSEELEPTNVVEAVEEPTTSVEESTDTTESVEIEEIIEIKEYTLPESLLCDPNDEIEMLACVIYQEAGGNNTCDLCKYRIADVVLNRIEHKEFPNNMHDVLTSYRQYGLFYRTGVKWDSKALNPSEAESVLRCYEIAMNVIDGMHGDLYGEGYIWQAEFVQGYSGFWCCGTYFGKN